MVGDLEIVLNLLAKKVFPIFNDISHISKSTRSAGRLTHYTTISKNKIMYSRITLNFSYRGNYEILKKKYKDRFIEILKEKDIDIIIGEQITINTKELLYGYRHLLTSAKVISKFNL